MLWALPATCAWLRLLPPAAACTQERGPPKTLSVQMSLTPQLLPMQNYHGGPATVSAAGGRAGEPQHRRPTTRMAAPAPASRCLPARSRLTLCPACRPAGVLEPLVTGRPDFRLRVRQLMVAMGLDLLGRVQEDAAEEARWGGACAGFVLHEASHPVLFVGAGAALPRKCMRLSPCRPGRCAGGPKR